LTKRKHILKNRSADSNFTEEELEEKIARYVGKRYAVLCSSGRSAIRFSLLALGIGRGHEVIIPDLTCQILPLAVLSVGALPKFCEIDRNTLALSSAYMSKLLQPSTKAVILVHPYGIPVDPKPFMDITEEKGIALVEDAAQALGAEIKDKKVGSFGDVGIFTFNKFLNVNSGAALVTDNQEIADKIKLARRNHETKSYFTSSCYRTLKFLGLESTKLVQSVFSYDNYLYQLLNVKFEKKRFRIIDGWVEVGPYLDELPYSKTLTNILMAYSGIQKNYVRRKLEPFEISLLTSEFENLDKRLQNIDKLANFYEENLKGEILSKFTLPKNSTASYLRYPILFSNEKKRSDCINNLAKIGCSIDYTYEPLHTSPFLNLKNNYSELSESIYLSRHLLPLPVHPPLNQKEIERIVSEINKSARM
jgi:dTDP-4-amino-4,6-dideoxygalactose transaminase